MAQNRPSTAEGNTRGYKTVLIARFSAIGDVAMTVPVIYSVCRCYTNVNFIFLTRPSMTSIFVSPPSNLTVLGIDLKEKYEGISGIRRLASDMVTKYHPDVFVDLHNVLRSRLLALFLRIKGIESIHLVKSRAKRRALTRRHNKVMLPLTSQRARYREVFFKAGLAMTDSFKGLYGGRNCSADTEYQAITSPKPAGEAWVGIAPFAAHAGKIYPPEQMEKVVAMLQHHADEGHLLRIFLLGGGGEEQRILEKWADSYPAVCSLAGKRYGFKAEMALMNHFDCMVTMDSANMHLAALASTPTVSIWGATHPYCGFKAWHQTDDDTLQLPLDCRPCSVFGNKACFRGDLLCMAAIKPELIFNRILSHLQ